MADDWQQLVAADLDQGRQRRVGSRRDRRRRSRVFVCVRNVVECRDVAIGKTWWLALPVVVAMAAWLVTAPSHRYSPPLFWSLAALCVTECLRGNWQDSTDRGRRVGLAALIAIALSPLCMDPIVLAIRQGRNPLPLLARHNFVAPRAADALPLLGGSVGVTPFKTRSADTLNVPARIAERRPMPNACWDAALPCTPNPAAQSPLPYAGQPSTGLSVSGDWEMQDWPYYWQSFFLPEWRRRHGQTHNEPYQRSTFRRFAVRSPSASACQRDRER